MVNSRDYARIVENKGTRQPTANPRKIKYLNAFECMKDVIAADCLPRYPNQNKPFHIYTDASDFQMGANIMQENHPVAYFSRNFNPEQRNYSTIENELLFIVEILREFRTTLYG